MSDVGSRLKLLWYTALAVALMNPGSASAEPALRFDGTLRGSVSVTGNSLGLGGRDGSGGSTPGPSTNDGIGAFTDAALLLQVPGWPLGTTADWRLASSMAILDLPAGATVAYAELVWGGSVDASLSAQLGESVTLRTPSGLVIDVAPDPTSTQGVMSGGAYYGRSADVTAFIEGAGAYTVGHVPASLSGSDAAAGWSLHVVYQLASAPPRRIGISVVNASIDNGIAEVDRTFVARGLCMSSDAAARDARFQISAIDGDAGLTGDELRIAATASGLNTASRIAGPGRALTNAFGGAVTDATGALDTRGTFGDRNHGVSAEVVGGRQGWDVAHIVATDRLAADQREVYFRAVASGDVYGLMGASWAVNLRTPIIAEAIDGDVVVSSSSATAGVGQTIELRVVLSNTGDAGAADAVFSLAGALPSYLSYVADSFAVSGGPVLGGPVRTEAELLAGVGLNNIAAGAQVIVTLSVHVDSASDGDSWTFEPYLTYTNQACGDASVLGSFAPQGVVIGLSECGDGVVEAGAEGCDDGNGVGGDGCSASCALERGWACDVASGCAPILCGDGLVAAPVEDCDDGNTNDGDGCAADCVVEVGFDCVNGATGPGPDSACAATCGDGRRALFREVCDDGGIAAGDGCDASCAIEPGWSCSGPDGGLSVCVAVCGDGLIVGDEVCDDAAALPAGSAPDGCKSDCLAVDHGWYCEGIPSVCNPICGDGLIGYDAESCDDGNAETGDGCGASCLVESGWSCGDPPAEPSLCSSNCGDGLVRGQESCDDGDSDDGDGCTQDCRLEDGWVCFEVDVNSPTICLRDTDEDGVADDGDGSGESGDNICEEGVTTACDDNCPAFWNPGQTFPTDPVGAEVCPPYRGPRLEGGGGGCGSGGSSAWWFGFAVVLLAWGRRRSLAAVILAVVALSAADSRAQSVDPRLFDPALTPLGILGVQTSATHGHLKPFGTLLLNVANDELITRKRVDEIARGPLRNRTTLLASAGLGLWDRVDVAVWMPLHWIASGGGNAAATNIGDLRLGATWRVLGPSYATQRGVGFALAIDATFPTGGSEPFMSDGAVTVSPRLVLDFRDGEGAALSLNVGMRLRDAVRVDDLEVHHEVRFGIGAELPIGVYGLGILAELDASLGLGDSAYDDGGIAERETAVEMRGGLRWRSEMGLVLTAAAGSGVTRGYGAPDFRGILSVAYSGRAPARAPEPLLTAAEGGVVPDSSRPDERIDETSGKAKRASGPTLGTSDFDRMVDADPDLDADGILNDADKCPVAAEDLDGFEDADGCPEPDNDQDGIADGNDKCPLEKEVYNGVDDDDGCPDAGESVVKMVGSQLQISDRIRFRSGSAELLPSDQLILDDVARAMKAYAHIARFRIEGHTDNQGDREFNVDLAERRAWAARAYLIEQGVDGERLFPKGYGSTRPLGSNGTEKGRAVNRRVEFHVVPPGETLEGGAP